MDEFSLPSAWAQQLSHVSTVQGTSSAPHSNLLVQHKESAPWETSHQGEKKKKHQQKNLKFTLDSEKSSCVSDVLNSESTEAL